MIELAIDTMSSFLGHDNSDHLFPLDCMCD